MPEISVKNISIFFLLDAIFSKQKGLIKRQFRQKYLPAMKSE